MKENYPIEVDVLSLSDGIIIVGRKDELGKITGVCDVRELTWMQLKSKLQESSHIDANQVFKFTDFLEYVHGVIPVLLEIKSDILSADSQENLALASEVVKEIRAYIRKYGLEAHTGKMAVHSSNPYILRIIRDIDCMIPVGQISLDFDQSKYKDTVTEEMKKIHREQSYMDIIVPDFICYNMHDLPNLRIQCICKQHGIPLLAWTIKTAEEQETARQYCDNIRFLYKGIIINHNKNRANLH